MRAFWSGEIAFGLVTIPAKLYTATKDLTPQFHQLHKECGTRINLVRRCPKCDRQLAEVVLTEVTDKGSKSRVTLKLHQVSKETVDALNGEEPRTGTRAGGAGGIGIASGVA